MMATGVVDAFTYGSSYDYWGMSFHEISKYWLRTPSLMGSANEQFVVNRDIWNEMGDELQAMVKVALVAANGRSATEGEYLCESAWKDAIEYGITEVNWSAEDGATWVGYQLEWMEQFTDDPAAGEFAEIVKEYAELMGIL